MATEVTMPKLGLNMTEGVLSRWVAEDGEQVSEGDVLFELETDKATTEVEAETEGVLHHAVEEGATIAVKGVVGYILEPGEELSDVEEENLEAVEAEAEAEMEKTNVSPDSGATPTVADILATPAAKKKASELNIDLSQIEATRREGTVVGLVDVERFVADREKEALSEEREILASPLAKRMAEEAGIDLTTVEPSDPSGRITQEDVERAIAEREEVVEAPTTAEVGEEIPIEGVRAVIAERMHTSSQKTAPVTLTTKADAMELVKMYRQLDEELKEQLNFSISYNEILVKIAAKALEEHPYMNATQEEDVIRLLSDIHIGVAVDTDRGLLVPVVRNADKKSLDQLSRELREKVDRAVSGKSTPDELAGGTFTITNLGMYDVDAFTPIINPPQIAILGIGRIVEEPVAYKGEVQLRHQMMLSLTFDHRLVDGAPAARFLQRIKKLIEKPYLLMVQNIN